MMQYILTEEELELVKIAAMREGVEEGRRLLAATLEDILERRHIPAYVGSKTKEGQLLIRVNNLVQGKGR